MLEQFIDVAGEGGRFAYFSSARGVIKHANLPAARFFGFQSVEAFRASELSRPSAPGSRQSLRRAEYRFRSGRAQTFRLDGQSGADGETYVVSMRKIRRPTGGLAGILCVGHPLLDEATRQDFDQLRTIMDALPDIVFFKNKAGQFVAANGATAAMMKAGDTVDLVGKTDFDFYPQDLAEQYRQDEITFLEGGVPLIIEQPVWRPDGSRGYMCSLKVPVRDPDGEILGYVGHGRDVTETRVAEHKLRQRETELEEAQLLAGMGSLSWLVRSQCVATSAGFRRLLGLKSDVGLVRAQSLLRQVVSMDRRAVLGAVRKLLDTHKRQELIFQFRPVGQARVRYFEATLRFGSSFEGKALIFGALHDITEAREAQKRLEDIAYRDNLTGIANRAAFFDQGALASAQRSTGAVEDYSVLLIDLDGFKEVNDTYGHAAGDGLLKEVARRLASLLRPGDMVARLGGDEFTVLLSHETGSSLPKTIARLCVETLRLPIDFEGQKLKVTASVGIASPVGPGESIDNALARADWALYDVKSTGRDGYKVADVERDNSLGVPTRLRLNRLVSRAHNT